MERGGSIGKFFLFYIYKHLDFSIIMNNLFNLCEYKNMFGAPNTGLHSYRIFNIAIVDVVLTILAGFLISRYTNVSLAYAVGGMFIAGIIAHRGFCVRTTMDKLLF